MVFGQFHLFPQVCVVKFLLLQLLFQYLEIIPAGKWKKAKFVYQFHHAIFETGEKVGKVLVVVVVHIVRLRGFGEKHPAAPAEHFDVLAVPQGKAGEDIFQQRGFAPFP
jgi:hypothetical protein